MGKSPITISPATSPTRSRPSSSAAGSTSEGPGHPGFRLLVVAGEWDPPYTYGPMLSLERLRRVRLLGPATALLVMAASSTGPLGVERGVAPSPAWQSKLDPFLRKLAVGTFKMRGGFKDAIPRHSREAALSLPSFIRQERTDAPVVLVKAGMSAAAVAAGRQWNDLRPALAVVGVEIRGRVEG